MELRELTPSVDEMLALSPEERFRRVRIHAVASWYAHRGATNDEEPAKREWFAAWRHFLDEWQARKLDGAELIAQVQLALDAIEQTLVGSA